MPNPLAGMDEEARGATWIRWQSVKTANLNLRCNGRTRLTLFRPQLRSGFL